MSTIDFPTSPSVNDTYTFGNRTWRYNGAAWESTAVEGVVVLSTDIRYIVTLTQAAYDALDPADPETLYIVL